MSDKVDDIVEELAVPVGYVISSTLLFYSTFLQLRNVNMKDVERILKSDIVRADIKKLSASMCKTALKLLEETKK